MRNPPISRLAPGYLRAYAYDSPENLRREHRIEERTPNRILSYHYLYRSNGETCAFLSFDLADAYACLQIRPEFQQYFGVNIQGRLYEMQALPFGWSISPYAFCTAMKVLVRLLRSPDLPSVSQQQREQEQPDGAVA